MRFPRMTVSAPASTDTNPPTMSLSSTVPPEPPPERDAAPSRKVLPRTIGSLAG